MSSIAHCSLARAGGVLGHYNKRILMPFGEYIPFASWFPWIYSFVPQSSGMSSGEGPSIFAIDDERRVGQLVCYEDLSAVMARETTAAGAGALVNILNDAWYGDSAAPYQHQALALWRAVENRRTLLRASNSGVTSVIDPTGKVVQEGGLFSEETIDASVPLLDMESIYTRIGDVFAWICVFLSVLSIIVAMTRKQEPSFD